MTDESNESSMIFLPENNPQLYFDCFDSSGEIKFSREAAKFICDTSINHNIWIFGVDVGIIDLNGNYFEDFNEGWVSKTNILSEKERKILKNGFAIYDNININNIGASMSISCTPIIFNSFTITGVKVVYV